MGPLVSRLQYDKAQDLIQTGIEEGTRLVVGGLGKPEGLETGHFTKLTVFADADNQMTNCSRGGIWAGASDDSIR
jgi:aldehyde dehydrogenase (NAD+)